MSEELKNKLLNELELSHYENPLWLVSTKHHSCMAIEHGWLDFSDIEPDEYVTGQTYVTRVYKQDFYEQKIYDNYNDYIKENGLEDNDNSIECFNKIQTMIDYYYLIPLSVFLLKSEAEEFINGETDRYELYDISIKNSKSLKSYRNSIING